MLMLVVMLSCSHVVSCSTMNNEFSLYDIAEILFYEAKKRENRKMLLKIYVLSPGTVATNAKLMMNVAPAI